MLDKVGGFLNQYFLSPGYNIVNTLTYGLLLGFIVFRLGPRLRGFIGRIDRRLLTMLAPFVVFGATMRELVDQSVGVYAGNTSFPENFMYVSPGIYFTMFFVALSAIALGKLAEKFTGSDWRNTAFGLGSLLAVYNIYLVLAGARNYEVMAQVFIFFALSLVFTYALKILFGLNFLGREANYWIIAAHLFDASTTFVGVDFLGHLEKHVVPTFFIEVTGTALVMYALKIAVLIPALYVIDDELKDDAFVRRFVKFVIVVLGLGPAIRNATLLLMG